MNKLTVRAQLAIAFGGLTLLLMGISVFSFTIFLRQHEMFDTYVNGVRASAEAAHLVREAVGLRAIAARNLVLVEVPEEREKEAKIVAKAHADVAANMRTLKALAKEGATSEEGRQIINKMDGIEQRYGPVATDIVQLALRGKHDEAVAKMNQECRPLLAALVAASGEYAELSTLRSAELIAEAGDNFAHARNLLVLCSLAAVALAAAAGWLITRSLLRALGAEPMVLCAAAGRVASGDLTGELAVLPADTGSVLAAMQRMQNALTTVVASVRRDSEAVSTAAEEIAAGNSSLSSRTEHQASSLEETASSMEELTATVRQNADNARQASTLAAAASDIAGKGGAVVGMVVDTMGSISEASRKIVEIISVIDGIAFQTNILALNAAVEAARAGEQGRGFAVVASEVRNLAQRSAAAAKEIKTLIDNSVERVEVGAKLAADAGATMADVVGSVGRVNDMIAEITSASQEQSAGIEQVNQAIGEMDNVTQQNAALVEEAAAAAESLREQAGSLVRAVSIFNITPQAAPAAAPAASGKAKHALALPAVRKTFGAPAGWQAT